MIYLVYNAYFAPSTKILQFLKIKPVRQARARSLTACSATLTYPEAWVYSRPEDCKKMIKWITSDLQYSVGDLIIDILASLKRRFLRRRRIKSYLLKNAYYY
jgi:hypothetical protein